MLEAISATAITGLDRPVSLSRRLIRAVARRARNRHPQARRLHAHEQASFELEALEQRVLFSGHDHGDLDFDVFPRFDPQPPTPGPQATVVSFDEPLLATTSASQQSVFSLHSNPGASKKIFLDFDGHVTENTSWNNYANTDTIVTPAFDFNGDTSVFTDSELTRIERIFQRVAEDFMPFDVDVTTEEPAADELIKSGSGDTMWGIRVAIGGSSSDWLGMSAGGIAYINSFNWSNDTPTFVFDEQLGNGHEKYTAEAISHEVGHTLGLYHDGTPSTGYYRGHGSGSTGWAPIMGVGYYKNLSQWSRGEYNDANNDQDDLNVITANNGFTYRTDDHGSDLSNFSTLSVTDGTASASGLIERNTDYDVFAFNTAGGEISLDISVAQRGANLDARAELLDSDGNLIQGSNPIGLLTASINTTVNAGTYFLRISGGGQGDPLGTGYSDYGSLGQYTITGQIPDAAAPELSVADLTVNEEDGVAVFTVSLSQTSDHTVTVDVTTLEGTALQGDDFLTVNQTLIFAPGETVQTVSVSLVNDDDVEPTESFSLLLTNASGGAVIADDEAVATVQDTDQPPPTITIDDTTVMEGDPAHGLRRDGVSITQLRFTVSLSHASDEAVTVHYDTADGSAVSGEDYFAQCGSVTFSPGEVTKTITLSILGDGVAELDETVYVTLSEATHATLDDDQAQGTILNDDTADDAGLRSSDDRRSSVGTRQDKVAALRALRSGQSPAGSVALATGAYALRPV